MNKVKVILPLLLVCFTAFLFSQSTVFPTAKDRPEWCYLAEISRSNPGVCTNEYRFSHEIVMGKDTVMNGHIYTELGEGFLDTIRVRIGWIRVEGKKVWAKRYCPPVDWMVRNYCQRPGYSSEVLVYDFGAMAGDTLSLLGGSKNTYVERIEEDGTMHIKNIKEERYISEIFMYNSGRWQPGIGDVEDPLYFFLDYYPFCYSELVHPNASLFFSCYIENGKVRDLGGWGEFHARCKQVVSTHELSKTAANHYRIDGNPVRIGQPVRISGQTQASITTNVVLYDLKGRKILSKTLPPSSTTTIDGTMGLIPGMYVLEWIASDGYRQYDKLIVVQP